MGHRSDMPTRYDRSTNNVGRCHDTKVRPGDKHKRRVNDTCRHASSKPRENTVTDTGMAIALLCGPPRPLARIQENTNVVAPHAFHRWARAWREEEESYPHTTHTMPHPIPAYGDVLYSRFLSLLDKKHTPTCTYTNLRSRCSHCTLRETATAGLLPSQYPRYPSISVAPSAFGPGSALLRNRPSQRTVAAEVAGGFEDEDPSSSAFSHRVERRSQSCFLSCGCHYVTNHNNRKEEIESSKFKEKEKKNIKVARLCFTVSPLTCSFGSGPLCIPSSRSW
ncbi:hypothetical protein TRVL_05262 [Trypanosoma vivax]|nr:hypothetical protein TRVL_05262 [Trypanosoma vivax]